MITYTIQQSCSCCSSGTHSSIQKESIPPEIQSKLQSLGTSLLVQHGDGPAGPRLFYEAVRQGERSVVQWLLKKDLPPSFLQEGLSPLYVACKRKDVEMARLLLRSGANPLQKNDLSGQGGKYWQYSDDAADHDATPIHAAAVEGSTALVTLLLKRKVPIDTIGGDGNTPLLAALFAKQEETALFLIREGAKLNVKNHFDASPIDWAVQNGFLNAVQEMVKRGVIFSVASRHGTCLHIAAQGNSPPLLAFLLEHGGKKIINVRAQYGDTPLAKAVKAHRVKNVRLLVEAGADLSLPYKEGNILHIAEKTLKEGISHYREAEDKDKEWWTKEVVAKGKTIVNYLKKAKQTFMHTPEKRKICYDSVKDAPARRLPPKKKRQAVEDVSRSEADDKHNLDGFGRTTLYHVSMAIQTAGGVMGTPFFLQDLRNKAILQEDWEPDPNPYCDTLALMKAYLLIDPKGDMLERTKEIVKACVIGNGLDITFQPALAAKRVTVPLKSMAGSSAAPIEERVKETSKRQLAVYGGRSQLEYLDPRVKHQRLFSLGSY